MAVKTFIVKRSRWLRGKGSDSYLRHKNGHQCCLGFVGRQCNIAAKDLLLRGLPGHLPGELLMRFPELTGSESWSDFAIINDSPEISDKEREKKLKELAKKNGFRFKFVD